MVGPIRVDGLVSGIDFASLIKQLLDVERRPITRSQERISTATQQKTAFLDLSARMLAYRSSADTLSRFSFFSRTTASSSNESVLKASGTAVGSTGAYAFSVRQLAQSHQLVSNGFADANSTFLNPGADKTLTVEFGGGHLDPSTPLSLLNGGAGVDRGFIEVTTRDGRTGLVDLEGAVTVRDVVNAINANTTVNVRASVAADRIVLEDRSGGAGVFSVDDYGSDTSATDLGIAGGADPVSPNFLYGLDVSGLKSTTALQRLNDGLGVRFSAGADFQITDTDGVTFSVDLAATDTTVGSVLTKINAAAVGAGSSLTAALSSDGTALQLDDAVGAGAITVASLGTSNAALDLGLGSSSLGAFVQAAAERSVDGAADAVAGNRVVGHRLVSALNTFQRRTLNGGSSLFYTDGAAVDPADRQGVREGTVSITDRLGVSTTVNVGARVATTLTADPAAGATSLTVASLDGFAVGNKIRVSGTGGNEVRTVTAIDEGTNTVTFDRALAGDYGLGDTVRAENESVDDVLRALNAGAARAGVGVTFDRNLAGNGLRVRDTSGGAGLLTVADGAGTAATDLGITVAAAVDEFAGADLDPQYIGDTTKLSALNGGQGVYAGKFRVYDRSGVSFTVDLSQATDDTILDALTDLNGAAAAAGSALRARVNDGGDGILLVDPGGGAASVRVEELNGGRTARDLNIAGSAQAATPDRIDGSFEYRITIKADSTLEAVRNALNQSGLQVNASVINDGSGIDPYRLSILSKRTGAAGRLTIGGDLSALTLSTTAAGRDAVVLYGNNGGTEDPFLITSATNTIRDLVPGLTLDLVSPDAQPVTVTVGRDTQGIVDQARRFVETYNEVVKQIGEVTKFNPDTFETGVLFGDSTVRSIQRDLSTYLIRPVNEIAAGRLNNLAAVGIQVAENGQLAFDEGKFQSALSSRFEEVRDLFTLQAKVTVGTKLKDLRNGLGIEEVQGDDFRITQRDGNTIDVDISGANTVGELLVRINSHASNPGTLTASISADGFSLEFTDSSVGAGNLKVTSLSGGLTAAQLGIQKEVVGGGSLLEGSILNVKGDPGVGQRISERLDFITNGQDGTIKTRTDTIDEEIEGFNEEIEKIGLRLVRMEERLIRQFARLESFIAGSQATMARISGQFDNLNAAFKSGIKR